VQSSRLNRESETYFVVLFYNNPDFPDFFLEFKGSFVGPSQSPNEQEFYHFHFDRAPGKVDFSIVGPRAINEVATFVINPGTLIKDPFRLNLNYINTENAMSQEYFSCAHGRKHSKLVEALGGPSATLIEHENR
jgi:hypothetical protein